MGIRINLGERLGDDWVKVVLRYYISIADEILAQYLALQQFQKDNKKAYFWVYKEAIAAIRLKGINWHPAPLHLSQVGTIWNDIKDYIYYTTQRFVTRIKDHARQFKRLGIQLHMKE